MTDSKKGKRLRKWLICAGLVLIVIAVSGCQTITFYSQAIKGQYQIFAHEKKIDKLIADPETPDRLKQRLELLQSLRVFAETDLKLPVDGHSIKNALDGLINHSPISALQKPSLGCNIKWKEGNEPTYFLSH